MRHSRFLRSKKKGNLKKYAKQDSLSFLHFCRAKTQKNGNDDNLQGNGLDEMHYDKNPFVYMVASKKDGVIYIGVTSNLIKRIYEHKNNILKGFTSQYHVHKLVWYEIHSTMESAITREKKMKKWQRELKVKLIEKENANWNDLYETL